MRNTLVTLAALVALACAFGAATASAASPTSAKSVKDACPADPHQQITNYNLNIVQGGVSTATFTVAAGCTYVQVSLVSYSAPAPFFTWDNAAQQVVYDRQTLTVGAGDHTFQVHTPDCYYQVDLAGGDVISQLGPANSGNFYSSQGRLISSANGGTQACASTTAWTAPPTPLPQPKIKVQGKKVKDLCRNIKGIQAKTPHGYQRHGFTCTKPKPKPKVTAPTTLPYTP